MIEKDRLETESNVVKGIPASSGIVIGKAYVLDKKYFCALKILIDPEKTGDEIERFRDAIDASLNEMSVIKERTRQELGGDIPFMIFDAHAQILKDPSMQCDVEKIITREKCNAEWALKVMLEGYHERFSRIKDSYFRERLQDIEQVVVRIQHNLVHGHNESMADLEEPVVLVAHDLTPADTLQIDTNKVIGIATDAGGRTSHAGILASSMDIPAVVGLKDISIRTRTGDPIIVDGNSGLVVNAPTRAQFMRYNTKRQSYLYFDEALHAQKDLKATTLDGATIKLLANIESSHDLEHLREHGAEGVGLYRTEYLYINRRHAPGEEEQFEDYKKVAELNDSSVSVIRTFDLGGDKLAAPSDYSDPELNPALGLRAIRFCLANEDIFKTQLRAILRASAYGALKIMYPLITTPDEVIEANIILEKAKDELTGEGVDFDRSIPVGIMMETPAAVMIAPELARLCSFFSIGTNDLIQYTMAIDRVNEKVAYLYRPLSPSILRMLARIIESADTAGISTSVCGKMAGDPTYALLLIGLGGVRELSMDVHSIPKIKKFIRSIKMEDAEKIAGHAIQLGSTEEIRSYVVSQIERFFVEGVSSDLVENDA